MIADYGYAGNYLGVQIYKGLSEWLAGKAGEALLLGVLKKSGKITPEDFWRVENKVKLQQFSDECKILC